MEALATGYGLIEGPVWDPDEGLYWSDVAHGGVHRLARSGAVTTVIPHRRGIGGMARHADGGLVVGGRNIAWKSLTDDRGAVLDILRRQRRNDGPLRQRLGGVRGDHRPARPELDSRGG